jgi:hypothetical protein
VASRQDPLIAIGQPRTVAQNTGWDKKGLRPGSVLGPELAGIRVLLVPKIPQNCLKFIQTPTPLLKKKDWSLGKVVFFFKLKLKNNFSLFQGPHTDMSAPAGGISTTVLWIFLRSHDVTSQSGPKISAENRKSFFCLARHLSAAKRTKSVQVIGRGFSHAHRGKTSNAFFS